MSEKDRGMYIRAARADDQPAIKDIIRQARINRMGLDWRRFLVVEEQGAIVGVGQIKPHRDGTRELASLAMAPGRQGQGVGRVLVQALLSREPGTLYLMCLQTMQPYYVFFGFRRLRPAQMPPYFRWASTIMNIILSLLGSHKRVIVMRRD